MSMFDPMDRDSMFFQDEFINRDEDRDDGDSQACPDCGETISIRPGATTVRCSNCGSTFQCG